MDKKNKIIIITIAVIFVVLLGLVIFFLNIPKEKNITYNVTFDSNGGTEVQKQIINQGELVEKPEDPKKEGYIFVEWRYEDKLFDFNTEIEKDITLKAEWLEVTDEVELVTIKFDSDGGTTISNQIIEKNKKVTQPSNPIKEGYTFKGWLLNNKDYNFDTEVTSDITLVAKWEKEKITNNNTTNNNSNNNNSVTTGGNTNQNKPTVKSYTVTFNSKGGSDVASQTVTEGSKATQPSNPTRSGYTFVEWTLNGSTYNFNTAITGNITLVAKWNEVVKKNYTVTFDSNGGSLVSSQTVIEGNRATQPTNPTRNGYTFEGWTLNGSAYNFSSAVTGNLTLVARWTQKSYTIKISAVDDYSPARVLSVYEEGSPITVQEIRYTNGTYLCSGSNPNVNKKVVAGITSFIVVLSDGTQVTATVS